MAATIQQALRDNDQYSIFYKILKDAELDEILSTTGPFTVLAPINDAFRSIDKEVMDKINVDDDFRDDVALYHIITGNYPESEIRSKATPPEKTVRAKTAQGEHMTISLGSDTIHPNGATVTVSDIVCSNGTIHAIDRLLSPHTAMCEDGKEPVFELHKTGKTYEFRLVDTNGEIVTIGRGYVDLEACKKAVYRVKDIAAIASVEEK